MGKGFKREGIKNPKFRDQYDEAYSEHDLEDMFNRKKKLGKNKKRKKSQDDMDWPGA